MKLLNKKNIVLSGLSVLIISGTGLALRPAPATDAGPTTPLEATVENHEQRIGDLEVKTDQTQTQVNQNTEDVRVIREYVKAPSAPPVEPVVTPVAEPAPVEPAPAPAPEPQPTPHPRTVIAVEETLQQPKYPDGQTHRQCDYTLYDKKEDSRQGVVIQPASIPCYKVGDILPYY